MNVGAKPETIEKLRRVNKLRAEISVAEACRRAGVSTTYYRRFPKKYPDLLEKAGDVAHDR